jgi:hypothetical protein
MEQKQCDCISGSEGVAPVQYLCNAVGFHLLLLIGMADNCDLGRKYRMFVIWVGMTGDHDLGRNHRYYRNHAIGDRSTIRNVSARITNTVIYDYLGVLKEYGYTHTYINNKCMEYIPLS